MNIFGIRSARKVVSGSPVVKGIVSPMPVIPSHISRPEYASNATPHSSKDDSSVKIYNPKEYPSLRESGKLARRMLDYAESLAKPGVSTDFIDSMVLKEIIKLGAYPSPVNYYGFPKAICTSVNEVVCHGIPDSRILQEGDMLSIDVSVFYNGYHGDNCGTVIVGEKKREVDVKLIQATREALSKAIGICKPGTCLSKIGLSIQTVASTYGFNVVHEFCGHGTLEWKFSCILTVSSYLSFE